MLKNFVGFQAVLVGKFLVVASEKATNAENAGYDRVKDLIKTLISQ